MFSNSHHASERRSRRRAAVGTGLAALSLAVVLLGSQASVGQAVHASCAIPWIFRPVRIGGREYVDGGVWSLTNMDVAPAGRGTDVLCLSVTGASTANGPLAAMGRLARSAATVESLALRNRGAIVRTVAPDGAASTAIGPDLMDRSRVGSGLAAGYRQGLALSSGG